jgi:predicted metal-dependent peptidase
MDISNIKKMLVRAIVEIARDKEFYGHIIQQFQRIHVKAPHPITTAAVGRVEGGRFVKLYLCDEYFVNLIKDEVKKAIAGKDPKTPAMKAQADGERAGWRYTLGAMEHEIMHVALGHIFMKFDDPKRGNYAMDCVVNSYLKSNQLHESWIHPSRYGLETGKSTIWYYKQLEKNEQYNKDVAKGEVGDGMIDPDTAHSLWEDIKDDPMTKEFVKDIVRKSKDMCNGSYGNVPGDIMETVNEQLKRKKPMVPWNHVLRMFAAMATDSILDYTQKRVSRRFGTRPGTRKGDVLDLALIIDTSMSMSLDHLKLLWGEVFWIWKNGAKVTVYECDTYVHKPIKYKGKWDGKVHGRGGTYFDLALAAVEKNRHDAAIYFTDGYAPKVKKRFRIPVLFVLTTDLPPEQYPYQWGKTVKIAGAVAAADSGAA